MIRIFNQDFQFITEIDAYQSLIWTRRWNKPGEFQIVINSHAENVEELKEGRIVSAGKNKAGIIAHIEEITAESGKGDDELLIKGYDLKGLIGKRVTIPPVGLSQDSMTANAETIMKGYVDRNAITTIPERVIPDLTIAPNLSRGSSIFYQSRYKPLSEDFEKISNMTGIGWDITFIGNGYVFDVSEGRDLSTLQSDNPPVIFSAEFDNVKEQKMVDSSLDYKNAAIVAGQGEGSDREIVLVGGASGLERNEVFIDARDIEDGGNLSDRGLQKLSEYERVEAFETSVLAYGPFIYGEDWDLGDIVTVKNTKKTRTAHLRVSEVTEVIEVGGYQLDVIFGKTMQTIAEKIKRELDDPAAEDGRQGATGLPGSDGIQGPKGDKGDTGSVGLTGDKGDTGSQGIQGIRGLTGETGAKGDIGQAGYTPIKDVDYFDGIQGTQGIQGEKGEQGNIGLTGSQGIQGIPGNTGAQGVKGDTGDRGLQGVKGDIGLTGSQGLKGDTGQPGYTPVKNIDYFDGAKGDKGDTGLTGNTGAKGDAGLKGDIGLTGPKGDQGDQGIQGVKGDPGDAVNFKPYHAGTTAPTNNNLIWYDTN